MQVIDYFSEIQSLLRSSIFIESADVEYEVKSRGRDDKRMKNSKIRKLSFLNRIGSHLLQVRLADS